MLVTLAGAVVVGFGAGLLVGRGLDGSAGDVPVFEWTQSSATAPITVIEPLATVDLFSSLDLSVGQRASIDSILAVAQSELDSVTTPVLERMREAVARAHDAVRARLDDRQIARFDSLLASAPVIRLQRAPP